MPRFRFGIVAAQANSGAEWKALATRAEAAGYSSLLLPDTSGPLLAPFAAMATAAAVTTTLHVGNWVLAPDFRNPVLLAREAATLAMLSDNRLELGFGAGRNDNDYAALGLGQTAAGAERVQRLAETLDITTRLFKGEVLSVDGRHYTVRNATLYPKLAKPPRILIAAARTRALQLAGEYADIVALPAGSRDQFVQQVGTLKAAAAERFDQLELACIIWPVPSDNQAVADTARARVRMLSGSDIDVLLANGAPMVLGGSRDSMIEQLQERRETLRLSYIVIGADLAEWFAPIVERLAGT